MKDKKKRDAKMFDAAINKMKEAKRRCLNGEEVKVYNVSDELSVGMVKARITEVDEDYEEGDEIYEEGDDYDEEDDE